MSTSAGSTGLRGTDAPNRSAFFDFGGRRIWLALAALALVSGAALNWSWLAAAGIAPVLLAFAPCAAMCALGLCMKPGAEGCKRQAAADSSGRTATVEPDS